MIVPFALDYEAFEPVQNDQHVKRSLTRLLAQWNAHGVLVCEDFRKIRKIVDQMPASLKKPWQTALMSSQQGHGFWRRDPGDEWSPLHAIWNTEEFKNRCVSAIALACVAKERAEALGLATDQESDRVDGVEVAQLAFSADSESFGAAQDLSQRAIKKGEAVEDVWRQRFEPLARACKKVVIVDAFAGDDFGRQEHQSGIRRVLEYLASVQTIKSIEIFVRSTGDETQDRRLKAMGDGLWKPPSQCAADLVVLDRKEFQRRQHARYIRFDHLRCVIDAGIGNVFGGATVQKVSEFSLKADAEYRDFEGWARGDGQRRGLHVQLHKLSRK